MKNTLCKIEKKVIPTYPEPPAEELPMFCENRVHQRTSGNPYPNKVVLEVDRSDKIDREYTVVVLENEYVRVEILPEIGGRIYSALDKITGYDFFYKQHVIKPALIGVLGSWISGGVEFNWPFHHRASGFMPCDYRTQVTGDGTAICWLSEHDPIDRMKGEFGIVLRPDSCVIETRMRLFNRTDTRRSFLWWENAAVPVNESYQIFFPEDVSYVNFHYLKSRATYPVAGNVIYNGIPMEQPRDISMHKNTKDATSYFCGASEFDFFGGYDYGKDCGVVHVADHHIAPGRKMFTWGYNQLSKSWENALTDTDGQYAELMAGSYSDNQPNFSWLQPYETKEFSQCWYPISKIGTPNYACLKLAMKFESNRLLLQPTENFRKAVVSITADGKTLLSAVTDLTVGALTELPCEEIPACCTVRVTVGKTEIACYERRVFDRYDMPPMIEDMPCAADMKDVQELYLAGVHVEQYRDPAVRGDAYFRRALERCPDHIPSLTEMARLEYQKGNDEKAAEYAEKAVRAACRYNERTLSGDLYYVSGRIAEALGREKCAVDFYEKAAWAADSVGKACTRLSVLDLKAGQAEKALEHTEKALSVGRYNSLAFACRLVALVRLHQTEKAKAEAQEWLHRDPLDHLVRYLAGTPDFYSCMDSNPEQTCLDLCETLCQMGETDAALRLLRGLHEAKPECKRILSATVAAALKQDVAAAGPAASLPLGPSYPIRRIEKAALSWAAEQTGNARFGTLLGCLLYHFGQWEEAEKLFRKDSRALGLRNSALVSFNQRKRPAEALERMAAARKADPASQQLVYETAVLLDKTGRDPQEKIRLLTEFPITRDDCLTELAKAYNQAFLPQRALETLLSHNFVPCEGGEHAIADQYMAAHFLLAREKMSHKDWQGACTELETACVLPQSLGAGLWNRCKKVPYQYLQAVCLEHLGETEKAAQIFRYIAGIGIEYFSNMHLKELPYYQAKSLQHLEEEIPAQQLITRVRREWSTLKEQIPNGYANTTPFFLCFTDDPIRLRDARANYLMALIRNAAGEDAREQLAQSDALASENLFALSFEKQGFLE